jgi:hypothetical protein
MKAFNLLFLFSLLSLSIYAQESAVSDKEVKKDSVQVQETKNVKDSVDQATIVDQALADTIITNSGSFTLDANDAVVETISGGEITETVVEGEVTETINAGDATETVTVTPETTTYHYNNYKKDRIQTLGGSSTHNGGFGGFSFKGTEFNDKNIIMLGIRGGWIVNRVLAIGFDGYGIIPTAEYDNIDMSNFLTTRAVGGYGGMFLEPIVLSNKVVHLTFPISGGAGWIGYILDWEQNNYYNEDLVDDDVFWYIEPGASLELNVARNFRIDLGASYRFTEDLELVNTPADAFEAWNYFITFKFGSF